MSDTAKRLATEQRKRLVASVLNHCERSPWWSKIGAAGQKELREKVLTSVGVYHDFILDLIKVSEEDAVRNELVYDVLRSVHTGQRRLESTLSHIEDA